MEISSIKKILNYEIGTKRLNPRILSLFLKQFSVLLKSGVPIDKSLETILKQNLDKKLDSSLNNILEKLNNGYDVFRAFKSEEKRFGPVTVSFIESGQETGNLSYSMDKLSYFINEKYENNNKIKQAFTYPIILLVVSILVISMIMQYVMPSFIEVFESMNENLPLSTRILIRLSEFSRDYSGLIFLILIIFVVLFFLFRMNKDFKYKSDRFLYRFPMFRKYRNTKIEYQISSLMYILYNGDVDIIKTINIIRYSIRNEYINYKLTKICKKIEKGYDISKAFEEEKIFSDLLISMISIGEDTGNLSETMEKTSDYFSKEYLFRLKRLSQIMEPVLIIIMSLIVAFIVFSVALPMFNTLDSMNY